MVLQTAWLSLLVLLLQLLLGWLPHVAAVLRGFPVVGLYSAPSNLYCCCWCAVAYQCSEKLLLNLRSTGPVERGLVSSQ